jgi:hypothetical protein
MKGEHMSGRLLQKNKGNPKVSKIARNAWKIQIVDNDKKRITKIVGSKDLAERELHELNELKMNNQLHRR